VGLSIRAFIEKQTSGLVIDTKLCAFINGLILVRAWKVEPYRKGEIFIISLPMLAVRIHKVWKMRLIIHRVVSMEKDRIIFMDFYSE